MPTGFFAQGRPRLHPDPAATRRRAFTRIALILFVLLGMFRMYTAAQPDFTDWSAPVNLGPVVNSAFSDVSPAVSKDGRSLYFASGRPGFGAADIWVSQWNTVDQAWGPPVNLGEVINTAFTEVQPNLSRDGHWLFFTSNRPSGNLDIWVSHRQHIHDDFAWQPPVNLGPGVNTAGIEQDPNFFANDDVGVPRLFFSRGAVNTADNYVSNLLPDGTFGTGVPVPELNSTSTDRGLSVRFDGLEAFFLSNRPGGVGLNDLWTATRRTVLDPWSAPTNLGLVVNSSAGEQDPEIAADRETLYFNSNRAGGFGDHDLYVITRTKQEPSQRD